MASKRRTCRKRAPRNHEKLLTVSIEDPYKGKKKNKDRVVSYNLSFIDTPPKGYDKEAGVLTIDVNKKINGKLYNVIRYADLDDSLKGKGYGKLLYETALFHLGTITTHYHESSCDAKRVWKSLHRRYKSEEDFFEQILTIYKRRRIIS